MNIDFITDAISIVEDVGVHVETVVALGNGVGQRQMEKAIHLVISAQQTKIVKRTDPGIIVQVVVVVLKRKQLA